MSGLMEYNGSAVLAMTGDNCVGIATDRRLGVNMFTTISASFPKVYRVTERALLGVAGLATDAQTLRDSLRFKTNLYALREEREMRPQIVSNLLSTMLYGRRFAPWFVTPVVAGLEEDNKPFISTFDYIGAPSEADDFVVAGAPTEQLYGACESFWKKNMDPEELFEVMSQCFLASIDRSCVAGWGATVYIMTPEKLIRRDLKSRMD